MTVAYTDTPTKVMIYPALLFMITGMCFGVFIAFNSFLFPDYFSGEYVHFGRVRPVHVGSVTLLWLLSADIGLIYYFVQRLCGVPLWSPTLAFIAAALWWPGLIIGTHSYPWGTNFGWEYAELPNVVGWIPVKSMVTFAWICVVINIFMTIAKRRYEKMYVSLWYTMGTAIWTTFTLVAGFWAMHAIPGGISRVNLNFFYVHNLVGLIFTPMGLATAYYALPKLANRPIYSHRLSMVGFWTIAFFYAWIGAHHIIHGPVTQWLQTTSIVFSMWLFIPVFSVVANLFLTLRGEWSKYSQSAAIRFIIVGVLYYLLTCIQGPVQSLRNVNAITSKTDWIIGHAHIALYGTFTFFAFAGIYQALPQLTKKPLWSARLTNWHFSLNLLGSIPFILPLWVGGFLQGLQWATWAEGNSYAIYHNNLALLPFLQTVCRHVSLVGDARPRRYIDSLCQHPLRYQCIQHHCSLPEPGGRGMSSQKQGLEFSALLTVIGVILLFSSAILITLIVPGFVDPSWTSPSSTYQQQMYEVADPNTYISSSVKRGSDLAFVYHMKGGYTLSAFQESATVRIIAPPELEQFVTRFDTPSPLTLTSTLLLLRKADAASAAPLRAQLQQQWSQNDDGSLMPDFIIYELYQPDSRDAFAVAPLDGNLENWVDSDFIILDDGTRAPHHRHSGTIYVHNPIEYRVERFTHSEEEVWRYSPDGAPIASLEELTNHDLGFRSRQELIAYGEHLYAIEGCWYCHTDQTRTLIQDLVANGTESYPAPPSSANEYIYQQITFPGTKRNGPDLSRVGIKRPNRDWHRSHFWSPSSKSKGSIMPAFQHFFDKDPRGSSKSTVGVPNHRFEAIYQYLMTKGTRITPPTEAWWLGKDPVNVKAILDGEGAESK